MGIAALVAACVLGLAGQLFVAALAAAAGLWVTRPPQALYSSSVVERAVDGIDSSDVAMGLVRVAGAVIQGLADD